MPILNGVEVTQEEYDRAMAQQSEGMEEDAMEDDEDMEEEAEEAEERDPWLEDLKYEFKDTKATLLDAGCEEDVDKCVFMAMDLRRKDAEVAAETSVPETVEEKVTPPTLKPEGAMPEGSDSNM